jgi:hypothetical protein
MAQNFNEIQKMMERQMGMSTKHLAATTKLADAVLQEVKQSKKASGIDEVVKLQAKEIKELREQKQHFGGMGSIFSKQRINYEISRMNPAMRGLAESTVGSILEMTTKQARANAIGRSLGTIAPYGKREEFAEGMGGFNQQLETELRARESGVKLTKEMRNLATGMRMTGQNDLKLIKNLQVSHQLGGLTNEGQQHLATTLMDTTKKYGIAAEDLIGGMAGLQQSLEENALGITDTLNPAIIKLSGKLGLNSPEVLRKFVNEMMSINSLGVQHISGVQKHVETMLSETSDTNSKMDAIESALKIMGEQAQKTARQQSLGAVISLNQTKQIYGTAGLIAASLSKMSVSNETASEAQKNLNENLGAFKDEFTTDVQKWAFGLFGGNQDAVVNELTQIKNLLLTATVIGGGIDLFSSGKYIVSNYLKNPEGAAKLGMMDLLKQKLLTAAIPTKDVMSTVAAEGAEQVAKGVVGGTVLRTAIVGALPWAVPLIIAGVGGKLAYDYYQDQKSQDLEELKKLAIENETFSLHKSPRSTVKTVEDVNTINAELQRENKLLLESMLKELKKANSNSSNTTVKRV